MRFPPPVLTALPSHELCEGKPVTLRCQTKPHSQTPARRLLFSFHKDGRTLQNRSPRPELRIPAAKEGDSGLYWCKASPQGGGVQKRSPQLELRVWSKWGGETPLRRLGCGQWAPDWVGRGP